MNPRTTTQYIAEFDSSLGQLIALDNAQKINAVFINSLRDGGFRLIASKKLPEFEAAIRAAMDLVNNFYALKVVINRASVASQALSELKSAADNAYDLGQEFANAIFANQKPNLKHINLAKDIMTNAKDVVNGPQLDIPRKRLKASIEKLNSELETSDIKSAFYKTGRALSGALACLVGVAICVLSLTTGVGLLATLAFGLFTWGKHWGPLTVGKDIAVYGANKIGSGPSKAERTNAKDLSADLTNILEQAEKSQQPAPRQ